MYYINNSIEWLFMGYTIEHTELIENAPFKIRAGCSVRLIQVKINDMEQRIQEVINAINDMSWCYKIADRDIKEAYIAARDRTIKTLMTDIFNDITLPISQEVGEYVISTTAQEILVANFKHNHVPLSELWKEKTSGNPGFDFHTVTPSDLIMFGEAKFSKKKNPYGKGIEQASRFIEEKKDKYDKTHLLHIIKAQKPLENFSNGSRAFCVAFSLNTCRPKQILYNAAKHIKKFNLDLHPEFFVIGVEICQ